MKMMDEYEELEECSRCQQMIPFGGDRDVFDQLVCDVCLEEERENALHHQDYEKSVR
ncbi:hypothetical protein [Exiguobacterium sp. s130]|uniref:hypothetical protein n=2 Tax=Exiguobacterium TaxID=33986 RepID=UPI001BE6771D|nr:hypothetical protein [Exiguobacterium sp. s130]